MLRKYLWLQFVVLQGIENLLEIIFSILKFINIAANTSNLFLYVAEDDPVDFIERLEILAH